MKVAKRPVGSWTFIPASDKDAPPAEQTRIICRQLTVAERLEAWDNLNYTQRDVEGNVTLLPRNFQLARELCILAIEAVDNFPLDSPKPWPKDGDDAAKDAYLDQMPDMEVLRIGQAIRNNAMLEDDVKN